MVRIGIGNGLSFAVRTLVADREQSLSTSLTFMLSMTRATIYALHHGNDPATSHQYLWKTGSQNIPPLSRSCSLRFRTAGCFCTWRRNLDPWGGWSLWWPSCRRTNKRFILSRIIVSSMSMLMHIWLDVCTHKLREWSWQGLDAAVLDLCQAYLQIHIESSLWLFQTVEIKGTRYCLTRLGFGLNMALNIMTAIMNAVRAQGENVQNATSSYIDDIFVNENIMSSQVVKKHFECFKLTCMEPKPL